MEANIFVCSDLGASLTEWKQGNNPARFRGRREIVAKGENRSIMEERVSWAKMRCESRLVQRK